MGKWQNTELYQQKEISQNKLSLLKKHFQKLQQAHSFSMWSKINKNHINKSSTQKFKRIYLNDKEIDTTVERDYSKSQGLLHSSRIFLNYKG